MRACRSVLAGASDAARRGRSGGLLREPLTLHAEALGQVGVLGAAEQELDFLLELGVAQTLRVPDAEGSSEVGDVASLRDPQSLLDALTAGTLDRGWRRRGH